MQLNQAIVPFWLSTLDPTAAGYRLNHDHQGHWRGVSPKWIVTQARTLWFFAHLLNRAGALEQLTQSVAQPFPDRSALRTAADQGYRLLHHAFWDQDYGGMFWSVKAEGTTALDAHKHLFGHAAALYGVAEYALATQTPDSLAFAQQLFSLIEQQFHDPLWEGYRDFYSRDWQPASGAIASYMGDANFKQIHSHLHLSEALTTYYRLTRDPLAELRLHELLSILQRQFVHPSGQGCRVACPLDWTQTNLPSPHQISYGHTLETIWVLADLCDSLQEPVTTVLPTCEALFQAAQTHGWDQKRGGFYDMGRVGKRADQRQKAWRVQGEGLYSALKLYNLTQQPKYWDNFTQTLAWIMQYQTDWEKGDWHAEITPQGRVIGAKAGQWKCAYHSGRAVVQCLEALGAVIN